MLIGLSAACLATVSSVWLQYHMPYHIRPMLDPALHLRFVDTAAAKGFDRLYSFPSDTATLYFSLATVVLLENQFLGGIAFAWLLVGVGIVRVAFGWHYPSDILGSLLIGPGCVLLLTRMRFLESAIERFLQQNESRSYIVDALFCLFVADAYTLFGGLQGFVHGLMAFRGVLFGP